MAAQWQPPPLTHARTPAPSPAWRDVDHTGGCAQHAWPHTTPGQTANSMPAGSLQHPQLSEHVKVLQVPEHEVGLEEVLVVGVLG